MTSLSNYTKGSISGSLAGVPAPTLADDDTAHDALGSSLSDDGVDYGAWTRRACEASAVPLGVEDALTLKRLAVLMRLSQDN
jgi:hypothetical protein